MITCAKGMTSGYSPIGAMIASDRVMEPFLQGTAPVPARLHVRRPPGERRGRRWPTSTSWRSEGLNQHVLENEGAFRADAGEAARPADRRRRPRRRVLLRDRAGQGQGDQGDVRRRRVASGCCAGSCRPALFEAGLYCRADDRGDPVIQLAPPLICGQAEFDEMEQILRSVLTDALAKF